MRTRARVLIALVLVLSAAGIRADAREVGRIPIHGYFVGFPPPDGGDPFGILQGSPDMAFVGTVWPTGVSNEFRGKVRDKPRRFPRRRAVIDLSIAWMDHVEVDCDEQRICTCTHDRTGVVLTGTIQWSHRARCSFGFMWTNANSDVGEPWPLDWLAFDGIPGAHITAPDLQCTWLDVTGRAMTLEGIGYVDPETGAVLLPVPYPAVPTIPENPAQPRCPDGTAHAPGD